MTDNEATDLLIDLGLMESYYDEGKVKNELIFIEVFQDIFENFESNEVSNPKLREIYKLFYNISNKILKKHDVNSLDQAKEKIEKIENREHLINSIL